MRNGTDYFIRKNNQLHHTESITPRDAKSLEQYMRAVGKIDLLSPDEEVELTQRIKQGDEEALRTLVSANLRFVISVAKQYQNQGLSLVDLISEGNMGLVTAAERFDETKGFKFVSYAVWWIRQNILLALRENGRLVRLPQNITTPLSKMRKAKKELFNVLEREPTHEELADHLAGEGISSKEIALIERASQSILSFDKPLDESSGSDVTLLYFAPDEDAEQEIAETLSDDGLKLLMKEVVRGESERDRDVILCYLRGLPNTEIGNQVGLTGERVRQIVAEFKKKCKAKRKYLLKKYLG